MWEDVVDLLLDFKYGLLALTWKKMRRCSFFNGIFQTCIGHDVPLSKPNSIRENASIMTLGMTQIHVGGVRNVTILVVNANYSRPIIIIIEKRNRHSDIKIIEMNTITPIFI